MQTLDNSAYSENHTFFRDCAQYKMDYRQKMIMAPQQKFKNDNDDDDDDDEDLEALRLAALQSLRTKDTLHPRKQPPLQLQKIVPQVTQMSRSSYKNQRMPRRNYFYNRIKQRQNSNLYYQSPCNPNLIAIVPVDEHFAFQQTELPCSIKTERTDSSMDTGLIGVSKFHRFKDSGNGSEEEDTKSHTNVTNTGETDTVVQDNSEVILSTIVNETKTIENVQKNEDANDINDDDDDILLMADLEEEDSLERLMDEMEREMNVDKLIEKKDRKSNNKHENKNFEKSEDLVKNQDQKRMEDSCAKKESNNSSVVPLMMNIKTERRSISPNINRIIQKRRSLSPKSRSRKKSPRRSPRRSPMRQLKKSQREITRYRSPRKSPPRYSPRIRSPKLSPWPRSPRLSPRRSPNRSPVRRSPVRKLSPRGRSPKLSPHSRSPKPIRSRSPRISSRSRSPRPIRSPKMISRSRSPRLPRSRSPRFSPLRLSPHQRLSRSKSPRLSPRRITPSRRLSPRARSPGLSPRRGSPRLRSPRLRSPKISPRRSPRLRSPRLSPRRSPWSSPRNSPHLSPRRRRSPKWSPKELPRKHGPRSVSPVSTVSPLYMKDSSPLHKRRASPEGNREKLKREDNIEKLVSSDVKESSDTISDPILEARRRKFESTKPIDPINANKKIKLSNFNKKTETSDAIELTLTNVRKINKSPEEDYEIQDADLCLDTAYEFEELEDTMENASPIASSINSSINVDVPKVEKERSLKKKKKRDKEIYQVGKLKNELPLSERIGKDKKCKKRKDIITDVTKEDVDAIFEDITVDEEGDLRAELSRRRAERLNRTVSIQSARLVQSAFKGVVNEVVKNNAKVNQRHVIKSDDKHNQKDVRRVTVLHRSVSDLHDSEDESTLDSKVPIRFRLGLNKQVQDSRESKTSRKTSKRQGRKE